MCHVDRSHEMADVWWIEGPTEYANAATFVHGRILSPFLMGGTHHPMLASRDQEQVYIAGSAQDPHTPAMTLVTRPFRTTRSQAYSHQTVEIQLHTRVQYWTR